MQKAERSVRHPGVALAGDDRALNHIGIVGIKTANGNGFAIETQVPVPSTGMNTGA